MDERKGWAKPWETSSSTCCVRPSRPRTAAFALAAVGLNFHFGLTGLLNMGQAGFMLLGMYGFAITIREGGPIWLAVIVALAVSMVFGLLLGWPTLKLRGDYLAIVTIAAAEMVRYLGRSQNPQRADRRLDRYPRQRIQGPVRGPVAVPRPHGRVGPFTLHGHPLHQLVARARRLDHRRDLHPLLRASVALALGTRAQGHQGRRRRRALARQERLLVQDAGPRHRWRGRRHGGRDLGARRIGATRLHGPPHDLLDLDLLLLGGAATIFGPVLGSIIFWCALVLIKGLAAMWIPDTVLSTNDLQPFSLLLVGVTLMLLVIFRPQGVLGDKKELVFND